ncbi:MAG: ferric reductase-like transmembrane domain-containing protein [Candidatus Woesearchaeota archaeon]|nr:ferric reductase-like transmembrane domain-containing protein [Candidatus Woesearchaeota archaeon]
MDKKIAILTLITVPLYLILTYNIREQEIIWQLTRIFGLLSYLFLFITVMLGEMRLISKNKAEFTVFKYHTPIAIFSTFLVFLHFISAVMDKFKWGIYLRFTDFLGFNFSDKWMVLLSLGTLAFYLMLIIGLTSAKKSIQFLGFKRWKLVHFFSYVAFTMAYIHSMNLGTDLKTSVLSSFLSPLFFLSYMTFLCILLVRMIGARFFEDQLEINIAVVFLIILLVGGILMAKNFSETDEKIAQLEGKIDAQEASIEFYSSLIANMTIQNNDIKKEIGDAKNG